MREFFKKIILKEKYNSDTYINYLRKKGMKIGDDVLIYVPSKTFIDIQYPWMITIGNHVRITQDVKILTHDYAWYVLKGKRNENSGAILGASGYVEIGDNVFIGMNSIITRNVKIGNNVIIGVGSIVTKDCESNSVYVGNPAHKIMTIEEYYEKRKKAQLDEAKNLAIAYYSRFGVYPPKEVFHEFFMLFTDADEIKNTDVFLKKMELGGNSEQSFAYISDNKPLFKSFEEFLNYCFK